MNQWWVAYIMANKDLGQQKKKNRKTNLIKYQHKQKSVLIIIHMYSYLVILMPKQVMTRKA